MRSGNCTEEYFARCRGLSPSQLNKITTLQVLIVRLLQMQQHKTDISSIKNQVDFNLSKIVRLLMLYRHKFFKIILTHLAKHDILCHKSHWFCGLVWNHPQDVVVFILNTASPWIIPKRSTAPQHTRFILPPIHPTKSSLRCMGGIFLLRETHLENFMSRPDIIPTFRQRRCTNRGRNFVRSKRWPHYTSRCRHTTGRYYLTFRK